LATGAPTSGYGPHKGERSEIEPVGKRRWRGGGRMVGGRSPAREGRGKGGGKGEGFLRWRGPQPDMLGV